MSQKSRGQGDRQNKKTTKKRNLAAVIDGVQPELYAAVPSRGREALSRRPPGVGFVWGIIPEGAGFTLLAREDKHSLHMLRDHDKGIASLNCV